MDHKTFKRRAIVIVIAAGIGWMCIDVIIGFSKSKKQTLGRRMLGDTRQLDAAIDQWALETGQKEGATINTTMASTYLKTGWHTNDWLGHPYKIGTVGPYQIMISSLTKSTLAGVGIDWGSY